MPKEGGQVTVDADAPVGLTITLPADAWPQGGFTLDLTLKLTPTGAGEPPKPKKSLPTDPNDLLNTQRAAEVIGINTAAVKKACQAGKLEPISRTSRDYLFRLEDCIAYRDRDRSKERGGRPPKEKVVAEWRPECDNGCPGYVWNDKTKKHECSRFVNPAKSPVDTDGQCIWWGLTDDAGPRERAKG